MQYSLEYFQFVQKLLTCNGVYLSPAPGKFFSMQGKTHSQIASGFHSQSLYPERKRNVPTISFGERADSFFKEKGLFERGERTDWFRWNQMPILVPWVLAWVMCTLPYKKVGSHAGHRLWVIPPISSGSLYPCLYVPMITHSPNPKCTSSALGTQWDPNSYGPCPHGTYSLVQK